METDTTISTAPKPRLNLIFHGLMAFWDAPNKSYNVLIPRGDPKDICHQAWYGNPRDWTPLRPWHHDFDGASSSAPVQYRIEGVTAAATPDRPKKAQALVLKQSLVDMNQANVMSIINVPKPDLISPYRPINTKGVDFSNNDAPTAGIIAAPPDSVPGTIVFSYFTFTNPALVCGSTSYPIHSYNGKFWNLCIYCQPWYEDCHQDDSSLFNAILQIRSTHKPPKLNLYMDGLDEDNAPTGGDPGAGINYVELESLRELEVAISASKFDPDASGPFLVTPTYGGCVNGFVCDDGQFI